MTTDLPGGKYIQDIFADFIRYLFNSVKAFIQEREPLGEALWESLESCIDLILSHPNGWEGREQGMLRKSVAQAEIFTEGEARSRVSFVTEGEATFNFCVTNTKSGQSLKVAFFPFRSEDTYRSPVSSSDTKSWSLMLAVELSTSALTL